MVSAADKASSDFAKKFNERLGDYTGSRATPTTQRQRNISDADMTMASRVANSTKKKKATKKDEATYVADALAKQKTNKELSKIHNDKPWWGDVLSGAGRVLDIASRPSYAVAEGLRNVVESVNAGEPVWSLGDDLFMGASQGFGGKKKTGFGEVIEEATQYAYDPENPDRKAPALTRLLDSALKSVGGPAMPGVQDIVRNQDWERRPGNVQDTGIITGDPSVQTKRIYGIAGEFFGDPTTYIGGGLVAGLRGSVDNAARVISTEATKEATKRAVREGVEKALVRSDPFINVRKSSQSVLTKIENGIDKFGDDTLRYVEAGPQRGKALYGREMPRTFASHAANSYRQPLVESVERAANVTLKGFQGAGKRLSRAEIATARKESPLFGKYLDNLDAQAKGAIKLGQPVNYAKFHQKALADVTQEIDEIADDIYKSVLAEVGQATVKVPTVRVLGNDVISFRRTAGALDNVARKMGATEVGKTLKKSFSFADNFPGYTSLLAQKVKSKAYQNYEKFHADVDEAFRGITRDQKKVLTRALIDDTQLDSTLEPYRQLLKKYYNDIFDEEIESGLRSAEDAVRARNYNYVYTKGGNVKGRRDFKKGRKSAIHKTKTDTGYTFDEAKRLGLRPEEDAIRALLYRKKKSVRDMTRAWFQDDLVGHFGVVATDLRKGSTEARELVKINKDHVSKPLLEGLKEGEEWYVPKVVQDVFDTFQRMSTMASSEEAQQWLRAIDWVTRKFKAMATIPFPSYHIRNMMGDMYMGFIDGVRLKDYQRILGTKAGKEVKFLSIGGETMDFAKIRGSFDKTASSAGFMATDVTQGVGSTRNVFSKVREASQTREDFGRFAHYTHALDEEYGKLHKVKDKVKRFEMAEDAATYRVNKYKFDYGALTPFETSVMKRMVPFYTYTRKAIPTLTEALFLNPKIFSYTNKLLQDISGTDGISDMLAPDWMREIGYTKLTGEDEPLTLRHDFLPTNAFQLMNPGSGDQTQGLAGNLLGMLNPLLQAPMELATGRDSFSGAPVEGPTDILRNKIRPIKEAQWVNDKVRNGATSEQIFSKISGIGLSRITKEQQENQFKNMEDSAQRAVEKFNESIEPKGYRVRYNIDNETGEMEYRIIKINADPEGKGKTVATAKTIEEAKKLATNLANG